MNIHQSLNCSYDFKTTYPLLKPRARKLRRKQTYHEAILWEYLKNRRLNNLKFRRQFPIVPFIADFCCIEKNFIIELDGGHHEEPAQMKQDQERDEIIIQKGYQILRVPNFEVIHNIDGVIEKILAMCGLALPQGEGPSAAIGVEGGEAKNS